MSSTQKKINLNNLLSSENKTINDKMKGRNYKTFIKRIKANSTDKFEFSVIKNQNTNITNLNQIQNLNNVTSNQVNNQINSINFQSTNFSSKDKINDRYNSANISDKKNNDKRAKSGLTTSLYNLEILRKNQDSRLTSGQDSNKIPNSNETNPSSSSNKIDIKISFNYSKNNSLNKNNVNNTNPGNSIQNITNNNITNNNYANYYLRYKNLSKPGNSTNNNVNNTCYTNVNTSNNYDYLNTYSNLNSSIHNKTAILNTSYISKPTILQENSCHKENKERSKGKMNNYFTNVNNSMNFNNFQNSTLQDKNLRKKIITNESEITSDEMGVNKIIVNKSSASISKKLQSDSHFYQNNLNISLNNLENKPIITNYYSKNKLGNNSFAFNENLMDKLNRGVGMNSINFNKGSEKNLLTNTTNQTIGNKMPSINNTNSTGIDYNSFVMTNSASSENLIYSGKNTNSISNLNNHILHTDGNMYSDATKITLKDEEFTLNRKNNDFIEILDNIKIKETNNLESNLNVLEKKLDQKLYNIKQENEKNKILNLTKKYSAYKSIFEDSVKCINESNNFKSNNLLNKILTGYNDTVQTLFMNFTKLHEKFTEGESVYQNYKNLSRKYTDLFKSYESKSEELKKMQLKWSSGENNEKTEKRILITEGEIDPNDQLTQSNTTNFNVASIGNLNLSSINIHTNNTNFITKTNDSVILNPTNNKNILSQSTMNNAKTPTKNVSLGDYTETSENLNNVNKTFCNTNTLIKNALDFSQIKIDSENSVIFNNKEITCKKENLNNLNLMKLNKNEEEEDLIDQKNTKIMLKMIGGKSCIDDLDSIYFFDKIKMRSNSASITKVPKLDFNIMKLKLKKNEEIQYQLYQQQKQIVNNTQINQQNLNNTNVQNLKKNNLKIDDINQFDNNNKNMNFTTSNKNFLKINNMNMMNNNIMNPLKNSQNLKENYNMSSQIKKLNVSTNEIKKNK